MAAAPDAEFPDSKARQRTAGNRTTLATPLLRDGVPIGTIHIRKWEVQPCTDAQIRLLEAFADQAVIAIENARLFEELEQRTNDLTQALEQQTATSEILRVIATSTTDARPVLDAVVSSARQLSNSASCALHVREADSLRLVCATGVSMTPAGSYRFGDTIPITRQRRIGRALIERRTIHTPDHSDPAELAEFPDTQNRSRSSSLVVPLVREGDGLGVLFLDRDRVEPYSQREIALIETFANQAAIAIENARLFGELQRRVGELQALGEVGQAVSSSLDLQEVLSTIVAHATRLADADAGTMFELDEASTEFVHRASYQMPDELLVLCQARRDG